MIGKCSSVNQNDPIYWARAGEPFGTGVDITKYVHNSPKIDAREYSGIDDFVYNIVITPFYKPEDRVSKFKKKEIEQARTVDIHVLLVVRRNPFQ